MTGKDKNAAPPPAARFFPVLATTKLLPPSCGLTSRGSPGDIGPPGQLHWAKSGEYVTQVTAIGPLGLEYLDPNDDPRNT